MRSQQDNLTGNRRKSKASTNKAAPATGAGSGAPGSRTPNPDNYRAIPALAAYIDRVGAEQSSLRRFTVSIKLAEDGGHYRRDTATIQLKEDGSITAPEAVAPTDAEAAAIKTAFTRLLAQGWAWPESITHNLNSAEEQRRKLGVDKANWFVFLDTARTSVIMCQQRIVPPGAVDSKYLPWTFYSDGQWRCKEPDAPLPFWKPPERRLTNNIMVHEGAKAARYCHWLTTSTDPEALEALAAHPWAEQLRHYEHWGWLGGAANPHRVDWAELKNIRATEIVQVCDNDAAGMRAATRVAQELKGQNLAVLMWDERFPHGFDLADPWPERFFRDIGGRRVYVGPGLVDCCRPAVWATELLASGKGYKLRTLFQEQWAWTNQPALFISRRNRRKLYNEKEFNAAVQPFSDVENTAKLLRRRVENQAETVCYVPGADTFFITMEGERRINTWTPTDVKPEKGDDGPWLEFMEHLIPHTQDLEHVLKWCATLVARPEVRMRYGVLLIQKEQGVGKSTLMEKILAPLVGWQNCSVPSEEALVNNQFNYWKSHRRLALVHEIYAGGNKKAYNTLKSAMTDDHVDVNIKHIPQYTIANWIHIIAASNSRVPLQMAEQDRRWLVPKVTVDKWNSAKWAEFNNWLSTGGRSIIYAWAKDYVIEHGRVTEANIAPMSAVKLELIEMSLSEGQLLARDLAREAVRRAEKDKKPIVLKDREVREWASQQRRMDVSDPRLESLLTIRDALLAGGMTEVGMKKIMGVRNYLFSTGHPDCGPGCEQCMKAATTPPAMIDPEG